MIWIRYPDNCSGLKNQELPPLHRSPSPDYDPDGSEDDLEIKADAPVLDVFGIEFNNFLEVLDLAAAADLPQSGNTGFGGEAGPMMMSVFFPFVRRRGAGAHKGHVALQDIEELGEFVQGGFADKFTDACLFCAVREDFIADDSRIPVHFEHHAVLDGILGHELFLLRVSVQLHGTDLVHPEALAVLSDALGTVQDRPRARMLNDRANNGHDDQGKEAADKAAEDVQDSLCQELQGRSIAVTQGQDGGAADALHELLLVMPADAGDMVMDRNRHLTAVVHELADLLVFGRNVDVDGIDPLAADIVGSRIDAGNNRNAADLGFFHGTV